MKNDGKIIFQRYPGAWQWNNEEARAALVYRMRVTTVTKVACMHLLLDNGGNNRFIIDLTQNVVVGQKSRCLNFHKVSKRVRAEPKMDIKWLLCMGGRWLWPKYLTWLMTWHDILRLRWWIKLLNKTNSWYFLLVDSGPWFAHFQRWFEWAWATVNLPWKSSVEKLFFMAKELFGKSQKCNCSVSSAHLSPITYQ